MNNSLSGFAVHANNKGYTIYYKDQIIKEEKNDLSTIENMDLAYLEISKRISSL